MNTRPSLYTDERIESIWNSVAYNSCRHWAFFSQPAQRWFHPNERFDLDSFKRFVYANKATDVHVKATDEPIAGREWVVDVDFNDSDPDRLQLRMDVAVRAFQLFFGGNVQRIMYTGNRGVHVWLAANEFSMYAGREIRERYYKVFKLGATVVRCDDIKPGSFLHALDRAITEPAAKQRIECLFADIADDRSKLLAELFPPVDEAVFCHLNQIRAPFSYNHKGRKFSRQLL
ncbi:lef-1 [Leucania separata nucleopolyhedrovirus]|uniref:Lef-1 n=1 Tax=Leucania separata nucleopolyhedrovirus TaxID=1307956 RepID=Q0IKW9_NPVLS|nr:lef-1 [Leucania separata nucleopolyhedrovirus]AAR28914.1 lef-1 [Leucania separata nucleopolyhedrovirus]